MGPDQRTRVEAAVAAAEAKTRCEIVPAVATESGRYDRAEDIVGLWLGSLSAVLVWALLPRQPAVGDWSGLPPWGEAGVLIGAIIVGFLVGVVVANRVSTLRRLFIPKRQMEEDVNDRARQLFFDSRVHHTAGASGILIFVSLFEHMTVVLGDRTVVERLGEPFLTELCRRLTTEIRRGDPAEALCQAIHAAADRLGPEMPRESDDVNELPNALVLID